MLGLRMALPTPPTGCGHGEVAVMTPRLAMSTAAGMMLAEATSDDSLTQEAISTMDRAELARVLFAAVQIGGLLVQREAAGEAEDVNPTTSFLVSLSRFVSDYR